MAQYSHILLAVDLTEESATVAERGKFMASSSGARLSIAHVIEPLSLAYGGDIPMDLSSVQDQIRDQAKTHLNEMAKGLGIAETDRYLVFGRPETEIHQLVKDHSVDLVVLGSHGRHGLALLLGSTANGVLHGATCDVLAVRVGEISD